MSSTASASVPVTRTSGDESVVAGVASGLARYLGVDPVLVRLAFVVLAVASGIGVILYVVGAVVLPREAPGSDRSAAVTVPAAGQPHAAAALGMITFGLVLAERRVGLGLPDQVVWPFIVVAAGAAVAWSRGGLRGAEEDAAGRAVVRLGTGAALVALGLGTFAALNERLVVATQIMVAVAVTAAGVGVLAAPWLVRLGRQLADERAERARADERAAMATHLHDSVLQTLALIQRRADSPSDTVALARRQERELRSWLNSGTAPPAGTVAAALRSIADEVESDHAVTVDVVVVGDTDLDERCQALVGAAREAVLNAAKHSNSPSVSVYGEVETDEVVAYVRDRGIGFDRATVASDRRGLTDSIEGRLVRVGGSASVHSEPGGGTEVTLRVPRAATDS